MAGDKIVNAFHELYYNSGDQTWKNMSWLGIPIRKCPLDLWIYQEIIFSVKPEFIIECGTYMGGSANYMADICSRVGEGKVITIDIMKHSTPPAHDRIEYLLGSSTDPSIVSYIKNKVGNARALVVLDSAHAADHVYNELVCYAPLVSLGSYVIVEDSNVNGHPVMRGYGPGPMEAASKFLASNKDFAIDASKEKFMLTFNPGGYLKRISSPV